MTLKLVDGQNQEVTVEFVGNNGMPLAFGDLDADGDLDGDGDVDWNDFTLLSASYL